jgi:Ca2+-binding RTX toxin-like protein
VNLGTSLAQQTDAKRSIRLNLNNTFENLNGGAGKDLLTGNASANVINGNGGNDTLNGAAGNDLIAGGPGNDVYLMTAATTAETDTLTEAANAGIDSLDFSAITTSVTLNLSSSSSQSVHTNRTLKLNLESTFENASGGTANDSLTGNNEANVLVGNGGNDSLNGAGGNDILIGGTGGDTLNGAAGEDILIAGTTSFDSLFVQLNSLRIVWTGTASYSSRVASLRAGTGAPVVALKTGTTVFSDALSVDTLVGGTESDWFLAALNDLFTNRTISEELDLL